MRPVVVGASVTLAGHLRDEESLVARAFFSGLDSWEAHAPAIWPLEVANGLLVACRRGRVSAQDAEQILEMLAAYDFKIERQTDFRGSLRLLSLARRYELTIYDTAYLELSLRLDASLATLDARLARAADAAGIALAIPRPLTA